MTADEIRAVLHHKPFKPFTITTSDGASFQVVHPDYAMLTGLGNFLLVAHPGQFMVDWVDLAAVTRLSFEAPEVAA
jgi:hypothetical protein